MRHKLTFAMAGLMLGMAGCSPSQQESMKDDVSTLDLDLLPLAWSRGLRDNLGYGTQDGERVLEWGKIDDMYGMSRSDLPLFNDGLAVVRFDKLTALIDTSGEPVVDLSGYGTLLPYMTEDLYLAQKDDKTKSIVAFNRQGEEVFEVEGRTCTPMRKGYAVYSNSTRYSTKNGIINAKGEIVYEAEQDEHVGDIFVMTQAFPTAASLAHPTWFPLFDSDGFTCFLDVATCKRHLDGLLPDGAKPNIYAVDANDRMVVKADDDKYGLLRLDGTWAVEPEYRYINYDGDWYLFLDDDKLAGWMDKDGKVKIEPQFDIADRDKTAFGISDLCLIDEGKAVTYFIDRKGNVVLDPEYQAISNFIGDRCLVNLGNGQGAQWMNRKGELLGEPMLLSEYAAKAVAAIGRGVAVQYSTIAPFSF